MSFPHLFKSLTAAHLEGFRDRGSIRVGVTSEFRIAPDVRCDPDEATRSVESRPIEEIRLGGPQLDRLLPANVRIVGGPIIAGQGSTLHSGVVLPDAYLFSVAEIPQSRYGAYHYEIVDPESFGRVLYRSLKTKDPLITQWRLARVTYRAQMHLETWEDVSRMKGSGYNINGVCRDDYFRKSTDYEDDGEFRFVFLTKNTSPRAVILDCDELKTFCRIPLP